MEKKTRPKMNNHEIRFQKLKKKFDEYNLTIKSINDANEILNSGDEDLKSLAEDDLKNFINKPEILEQELKLMLLPKDSADDGSAFLEIRAGAGGDEGAVGGDVRPQSLGLDRPQPPGGVLRQLGPGAGGDNGAVGDDDRLQSLGLEPRQPSSSVFRRPDPGAGSDEGVVGDRVEHHPPEGWVRGSGTGDRWNRVTYLWETSLARNNK